MPREPGRTADAVAGQSSLLTLAFVAFLVGAVSGLQDWWRCMRADVNDVRLGGLVTYYVLFFLPLESQKIHVAGVTPHPNEAWMVQVARNVTMEEWGFLSPGQYLIHDRDAKFCAALQRIIDDAGIECVVLPPRSPNLNAYAER